MRAVAGNDDAVNSIEDGGLTQEGASGLVISFALLGAVACLVEETNYPGSSDQLTDGDEWDGWRFHEKSPVGSEFTATFEATS